MRSIALSAEGSHCFARDAARQRGKTPGAIAHSGRPSSPLASALPLDSQRSSSEEGNTHAMSLSLNLTVGWKPRNELVASVADWLAFRGRPSGRTVCSRPRSLTVRRTHFSSPYGRPLSMLTRTRSNSFVVKGALTRAVQFAGRSSDQAVAGEPQPSHARTPQKSDSLRNMCILPTNRFRT